MGQSAGAHIAACALLEQATKELKGESISWTVSQIKAYFGLSGGYLLSFWIPVGFYVLFGLQQLICLSF
jgi:hypothetical protein